MDFYHKVAGNCSLFNDAPPLAEVVLEDISCKEFRIIYAEAFKPGAAWWHSDGRMSGSGLPAKRITDFHILATRTPRPECIPELALAQLEWDRENMEPKAAVIQLPPITAKGAEVMRQQLEDSMLHVGAGLMCAGPDAFVSVFEPQHSDAWIRINTAGRVKFSEGLMLRFAGMKIDIAVDAQSGRVRIGEAEHGKTLTKRGYVFARRIVPLIDFRCRPSALVYLFESFDGYLYGELAKAEVSYGDVEG